LSIDWTQEAASARFLAKEAARLKALIGVGWWKSPVPVSPPAPEIFRALAARRLRLVLYRRRRGRRRLRMTQVHRIADYAIL
jgi:hypothetical protein